MRVDVTGLPGQQPHRGVGTTSQAVACRPNGKLRAVRPGLSRDASRPSGVSTRLGTTRLARIPRAIPSRAACRQMPSKAAFDASYAGIPVAARRLAAELMNTIAEPGSRTDNAAVATRKRARVLTGTPRPTGRRSSLPSRARARCRRSAPGHRGRPAPPPTSRPPPRTHPVRPRRPALSRLAVLRYGPGPRLRLQLPRRGPRRPPPRLPGRPAPIWRGRCRSADPVPATTASPRRPPAPAAQPVGRARGQRRQPPPAASRSGPHRRGIRRQRHGECVQQERDQRVVPAQ